MKWKISEPERQKMSKNAIFGPAGKLSGRGGSKTFRIWF